MSEEWVETTLGELVAIKAGKYLPKEEYVDDGRYWIYGSNSIMGKYDKALVDVPHVVMAAIGANAGAVRFSNEPSWVNNNAFALVPNDEVHADYLALWLESQLNLERVLAGTGQPYVKRPHLLAQVLPLPPLPVQRRITDLMAHLNDHLANLREERDRTKRLLSDSSEILMQGHPSRRVSEIAHPTKGLIGGPFGSSLVSTDYVADGIPVIRGANMPSSGMFLKGPFVFVSTQKAEGLSRNLAMPGDVILTQRGTLGQVGIVPDWLVTAVVSQSQMRLRVDPSLAIPAFVFHAFARPSMVRDIQSRNTATANPHINLGILAELDLPLPPLEVQAEIVESLGAIGQAHEALASEILEGEALRKHLISNLMSQRITVDAAYDSFLTRAA